MYPRRVRLATALIFAVLLLFVSTQGAAAPTAKLLQRQRLQAFTKYAERVGAALDLLANGPIDAPEGEEVTLGHENRRSGSQRSNSANYPPSSVNAGYSSLSMLTQLMQYPHTAMQAALYAVTAKVAAARTLAAVLTNSKLSEEGEAQLAQVCAAAAHANGFGDARAASLKTEASSSASPEAPAAPHRARATLKRQALAPTESAGRSGPRALSLARLQKETQQYISCFNGYVALSSDTAMRCATAGTTTIGEYMSMPEADRKTCSIVPENFDELQQQCICPVDALIIERSWKDFECVTRPVDLQVLLDDAYLCHSAADAAVGLPSTMESEYCIKTTRHAKLNLAVRWKYTYLTVDALKAVVETSNTFSAARERPAGSSALQWVVMGTTPPIGIIDVGKGSPYAKGNYRELAINTNLFTFLSPVTAEAEEEAGATGTGAFYVSSSSMLYEAQAFSAVFCFSSPRKTKDHLIETSLRSAAQMSTYFGNVNGTSTHTLHLDLSNVSDDFVEGNQMYVETGLRGGSTAYTYRVARLHISFSDLATPSDKTFHYKKQFNPLYILLIVAIGVMVLGAGLAVLWYHLIKKEEYNDNVVSDAQRKMRKSQATA